MDHDNTPCDGGDVDGAADPIPTAETLLPQLAA
jgi:hypothetical protein